MKKAYQEPVAELISVGTDLVTTSGGLLEKDDLGSDFFSFDFKF